LELGEKVLTFTNTVYLEQEDAKILKDNEEVRHAAWVLPFPHLLPLRAHTRVCVCVSCVVITVHADELG
jgi:hypothetical protein